MQIDIWFETSLKKIWSRCNRTKFLIGAYCTVHTSLARFYISKRASAVWTVLKSKMALGLVWMLVWSIWTHPFKICECCWITLSQDVDQETFYSCKKSVPKNIYPSTIMHQSLLKWWCCRSSQRCIRWINLFSYYWTSILLYFI